MMKKPGRKIERKQDYAKLACPHCGRTVSLKVNARRARGTADNEAPEGENCGGGRGYGHRPSARILWIFSSTASAGSGAGSGSGSTTGSGSSVGAAGGGQ